MFVGILADCHGSVDLVAQLIHRMNHPSMPEGDAAAENSFADMTPADHVAHQLEKPFPVLLRQRGGMHFMQVSSSVGEMEAVRARIRSQSKDVAEHIAADSDAQTFLDDWATPEPLGH